MYVNRESILFYFISQKLVELGNKEVSFYIYVCIEESNLVMRDRTLDNNLLIKKFKELSEKNERGLICYALPGYPNYDYTNKKNNDDYHDHNNTTLQIVSAMVEAGADIIELAIPFSDPIADGPIIQEASYQSLKAGTTPQMCLKIAQKIRTRYPQLPNSCYHILQYSL